MIGDCGFWRLARGLRARGILHFSDRGAQRTDKLAHLFEAVACVWRKARQIRASEPSLRLAEFHR
jgi:hypothetical protein